MLAMRGVVCSTASVTVGGMDARCCRIFCASREVDFDCCGALKLYRGLVPS